MPLHLHHHHHDQPPPPKSNPKLLSSILKTLIMTFITSFFFLILGFVAFLLFLILAAGALHRRRNQLPSSGFSPKHFKNLPQFRFRTQHQTASSDCVVCLDAFQEGQWCRKLPACGHLFHRRCLDTWLVKVSACPICRTPVRFENSTSASAAEEEEAKRLWNFNRNTNSRVW